MKCAQAAQWLQLYVDGRLDARRLERLEGHLEFCAPCQQDFALLALVSQAASAPTAMREPADLTDGIMRRVERFETRRAEVSRAPMHGVFEPGWMDAGLAAVLATLATICFLFFQPALRAAVSQALGHALLALNHTAVAAVGDSPGWLAWSVCIGLGLLLTLAFAGAEVRTTWRRNLMTRLPH